METTFEILFLFIICTFVPSTARKDKKGFNDSTFPSWKLIDKTGNCFHYSHIFLFVFFPFILTLQNHQLMPFSIPLATIGHIQDFVSSSDLILCC